MSSSDIREITIKDDADWLVRHAWLYPAIVETSAEVGGHIVIKVDMRIAQSLQAYHRIERRYSEANRRLAESD